MRSGADLLGSASRRSPALPLGSRAEAAPLGAAPARRAQAGLTRLGLGRGYDVKTEEDMFPG